MSEGWLRFARRLGAGFASPAPRGRLRLAQRLPLLLHNDEHRIGQDTQVNRSTEDHTLHAYGKVPSGYDGTGALSPSRHDRARTVL